MKVSFLPLAGLAVLILFYGPGPGLAQGSLTPPGPPGPTMKTLGQIEPRTPISLLPFTVGSAGSYYLTTNLTGVPGTNGISIAASDVTLDLNGFALVGVPNAFNGVQLQDGAANVLIRNGTIQLWSTGIQAQGANGCHFERLRLQENVHAGLAAGQGSVVDGCTAASNQDSGISAGQSSTIRACASRSNGQHGIVLDSDGRMEGCSAGSNTGSGLVVSNDCAIVECISLNNGANGIVGGAGVQINGSKASNNGNSGMTMGGDAVVTRCSASGNLESGIGAGASAQILDCKATTNTRGIVVQSGSTVRGCVTLQNSGDGISVTAECVVVGNTSSGNFLARDAAGVHASGTDNCLKENTVLSNDWGIRVEVAGNLIIKNTATNNSLNYFVTGTPQAMGPIVSGTALTDDTNPAANFEF